MRHLALFYVFLGRPLGLTFSVVKVRSGLNQLTERRSVWRRSSSPLAVAPSLFLSFWERALNTPGRNLVFYSPDAPQSRLFSTTVESALTNISSYREKPALFQPSLKWRSPELSRRDPHSLTLGCNLQMGGHVWLNQGDNIICRKHKVWM